MRTLCPSAELLDGGTGFRFTVRIGCSEEPAFAIRYQGAVYAYLNRCAHVPTELDWTPGVFFDADGVLLMCATHGALYSPKDGRCVGGRCDGKGLRRLAVVEQDGMVYLDDKDYL